MVTREERDVRPRFWAHYGEERTAIVEDIERRSLQVAVRPDRRRR